MTINSSDIWDSTGTRAYKAVVVVDPESGAPIPLGGVSNIISNGIPIGLPSSGSIGNNGALTGIAALPKTYNTPGIYLYFPANAIASGSAAGFYWVVMSSTTAGTIYNNVGNILDLVVPTSLTPFVTTGPGAYTQTTAEVSVIGKTVVANQINKTTVFKGYHQVVTALNANTKTIRYKFDSTTVWSKAIASKLISADAIVMASSGNQANQVSTRSDASLIGDYTTSSLGNTSINFTANTSLAITLSLGLATDFAILEYARVEL